MIDIRYSEQRGAADHGWLQSRHSFSFASYHDANHMGVSKLRVINDDTVIPGRGFDTHSHQDMEIISYVKKGTIEHKDSMGNIEILPAGEFQLMSAGSGVTHSEYNPSDTDVLEFLQIWIEPNVLGIKPGYQQKRFENVTGKQLIVSPDGSDGSLKVHQDAYLYQLQFNTNQTITHTLIRGRTTYVFVVSGALSANGENLKQGDAATVTDVDNIEFIGANPTQALMFDLP